MEEELHSEMTKETFTARDKSPKIHFVYKNCHEILRNFIQLTAVYFMFIGPCIILTVE